MKPTNSRGVSKEEVTPQSMLFWRECIEGLAVIEPSLNEHSLFCDAHCLHTVSINEIELEVCYSTLMPNAWLWTTHASQYWENVYCSFVNQIFLGSGSFFPSGYLFSWIMIRLWVLNISSQGLLWYFLYLKKRIFVQLFFPLIFDICGNVSCPALVHVSMSSFDISQDRYSHHTSNENW